MKIKKILLYLIGIIASLVLIASVVLLFIDFNYFKPQIQKAVKESIGKNLIIDGNIHINIIPGFHLTVGKVKLENSNGFSDPQMLLMDKLQVYISLFDLLKNKITIKKLSLKGAKIFLETKGQRNNWDPFVQKKNLNQQVSKKEESDNLKFSSINFSIKNAVLSYKNGKESYLINNFDGYGSFKIGEKGEIYTSGKLSIEELKYLGKAAKTEVKNPKKKNDFKGWSRAPIQLPKFMQNLEADLRLKITNIFYNKINLRESDFKFSSYQGKFNLSGETNIEGLEIAVQASQDKGQEMKLVLNSSMRSGDAGEIFSKLGVENIKTKKTKMSVEGDLDFSAKVSAHGKSPYTLVKSSQGKIDFKLDDGAFKGFNIRKVKKKVEKVDNFFELLGLVVEDFFVGKTNIEKFSGKFDIKKGIIQSQSLDLVAEGVKGQGIALINLPAFTGDVKMTLVLEDAKDFPHFKGKLNGYLSNLDFSFNQSDFISYFTGKSIKPLNNIPKPLEVLEAPVKILEGIFK